MNYKNYNFGETEVTAIIRQNNYIWISFLGASNHPQGKVTPAFPLITKLRKVSAFNLYQTYFELDVPVDKIVNLKIIGTKLYATAQDGTYIAVYYSTTDPLATYSYVSIPAGINEYPVDLAVDTDYFYLLTPGDASGENAKIIKYSTASTPVLDQTIDLTTITGARSIEIDASDNLWVVTYESPAKLIKVTEGSGGIYSYTSYDMEEAY